ncbi:MAG: hypothetical protein ACXV5J_13435 [Candidatus Angelobacter sp.]
MRSSRRPRKAKRTPVLIILITLLCDKTCTGTFVTVGVTGIFADSIAACGA